MRCIARIAQAFAPECGRPTAPPASFCAEHDKAPKWQKAAWASAYKRKLGRAPSVVETTATEIYDASNIAPRLWIGARPPLDRTYPGVDMIVLCAAEYQPRTMPHFTETLIHCPIPDDALSSTEKSRAIAAARHVAKALKEGKRALVTCQQGKNRSAFVAALALSQITKLTAEQLVELVRAKRHPDALYNPHFREYLATFNRNTKR